MPHKYEYTGDGTHTFPTLGKRPVPGEQFVSDQPLNSPFLKEVEQTTDVGATVATGSSVVQETAILPQQTEVTQPVETAMQQAGSDVNESAHQEDVAHTEGVDE